MRGCERRTRQSPAATCTKGAACWPEEGVGEGEETTRESATENPCPVAMEGSMMREQGGGNRTDRKTRRIPMDEW